MIEELYGLVISMGLLSLVFLILGVVLRLLEKKYDLEFLMVCFLILFVGYGFMAILLLMVILIY